MLYRNLAAQFLIVTLLQPAIGGGNANEKAKQEAVAKELKLLEGTWERVAIAAGGEQQEIPEDRRSRLTIRRDGTVEEVAGQVIRGTLQVDPTREPKSWDLRYAGGPNPGKTLLGIYEREGDELRICSGSIGRPRPEEFSAAEGSPWFIDTYRRVEPKGVTAVAKERAKAEAIKEDLKHLAGTWELVLKARQDRKVNLVGRASVGKLPILFGSTVGLVSSPQGYGPVLATLALIPRNPSTTRLRMTVLEDGSYTVEGAAKKEALCKFRLDPIARPKTIDLVFPPNKSVNQTVTLGIYELDGDDLHICWAVADRPRPTDFTFDRGSGRVFEVYRRVKDKK